ncbi:MAG: serine/threonine protein phosphatase PrpC [Bradymonadia bacterium]|jgi:serine/threonine protein phosphatase PrpC
MSDARPHTAPASKTKVPAIKFWAATDVGRTRDHNEDNFLVDKKLKLFVVADGMGGHAAGEVASSVAVHEVRRVISENRAIVTAYRAEPTDENRVALVELLDVAVRASCRKVFVLAEENPERKGMGTTLSFMVIAGARGFIGHVGDSRIYLVRDGEVQQLTEDHSLVNELIKRGRLKPGDAFDSPYKNAVTRAVGVYETVEGDCFDFEVREGDNYLLCSDGLSCYLDDEITEHFLTMDNVKEVPDAFIHLANEAGGKDNITAIVVRAVEPAPEPAPGIVAAMPVSAPVQAAPVEGALNVSAVAPEDERRLELATLRAVPLFKYVSARNLERIMAITVRRRFEAGDEIFKVKSEGDALYIVVDGRVELSRAGLVLATIKAGGHFGEMAMVDQSARSATARAAMPVRALVLERRRFFELMRTDPLLAVKLTWSIIQTLNTRLRLTNRELLTARDTIELLRRNQVGGVVAEVPAIDTTISDLAALPIVATGEFVPEFLFDESPSTGGTDPLIRIVPDAPDADDPSTRRTLPAIKSAKTAAPVE